VAVLKKLLLALHLRFCDKLVGLMNGRVYHPYLGRFTSSDPFVSNAADLQGLNRLSYVLNNPVAFIDPSGYECTSPTAFDCVVVIGQRPPLGGPGAVLGPPSGSGGNSEVIRLPREIVVESRMQNAVKAPAQGTAGSDKPKYCSSTGYKIGDFLDKWAGETIQDVGAGTVIAGGLITVTRVLRLLSERVLAPQQSLLVALSTLGKLLCRRWETLSNG
jgi:RHS repeat-associated protein